MKMVYYRWPVEIVRAHFGKYSPKVWKCETALAEIGDMV